MTDPTLQETLALIAEILQLCHDHPELAATAQSRAAQIVSNCEQSIEPSNRAQAAIQEHLNELRKKRKPINPPTLVYREIAEQLAKRHHLPLDAKTVRRKDELIHWFGQHWNLIEAEFFVALDNHPNSTGKKK
jgi:hypothetical protein